MTFQAKNEPHVIRVNVFRGHRQTVQYLFPDDAIKLEQAELLVMDDAAGLEPQVRGLKHGGVVNSRRMDGFGPSIYRMPSTFTPPPLLVVILCMLLVVAG